ncbi:peptidoglycan-binding domain-containing protein [Streptomyces sp. NPDC046831]|uniref:peptidoglycan-binding domain-containing protein n=1 Tax=Streptomyces sp. NPDC046831 TaxID=3154805 RepID=UPI003404EAA8
MSSSGIEAQCLLKKVGFDPGTIDGVFGSRSKAAAKAFQSYVNDRTGYPAMTVDGVVGSQTWPELRYYAAMYI